MGEGGMTMIKESMIIIHNTFHMERVNLEFSAAHCKKGFTQVQLSYPKFFKIPLFA